MMAQVSFLHAAFHRSEVAEYQDTSPACVRGRALRPGRGQRDAGIGLVPQASRRAPLPAATASDLPRCAGEITFDRSRNRGDFRRAVTLLEVVFSMGVILIGLLGLLSILPLAGRRAEQSVSLSVGTAIGEQMVNELEARRYLADGRLRPVRHDRLNP